MSDPCFGSLLPYKTGRTSGEMGDPLEDDGQAHSGISESHSACARSPPSLFRHRLQARSSSIQHLQELRHLHATQLLITLQQLDISLREHLERSRPAKSLPCFLQQSLLARYSQRPLFLCIWGPHCGALDGTCSFPPELPWPSLGVGGVHTSLPPSAPSFQEEVESQAQEASLSHNLVRSISPSPVALVSPRCGWRKRKESARPQGLTQSGHAVIIMSLSHPP